MNALVQKLQRFGPLDREDRAAIDRLCAAPLHHRADEEIGRGGLPGTIPVLLSGFAFRFTHLSDGRRQIHGLFLAGDLCRHIYESLVPQADHMVRTLTPSAVAMVPSPTLLGLMDRHPRVARALWANMVADDAILREWVVSLGRRTAYERMAHLFCEVFLRMRAVGLTEGGSFEWPLTQMDLGDLLGLSTVHVNRVLQQLRRDELVVLKGAQLTIRDVAALSRAAHLDPAYLHLDGVPDETHAASTRVSAA